MTDEVLKLGSIVVIKATNERGVLIGSREVLGVEKTYDVCVGTELYSMRRSDMQVVRREHVTPTLSMREVLSALEVEDAMRACYDRADDEGFIDRESLILALDSSLHAKSVLPPYVSACRPLGGLFDVIRNRLSIHTVTQVPSAAVRNVRYEAAPQRPFADSSPIAKVTAIVDARDGRCALQWSDGAVTYEHPQS